MEKGIAESVKAMINSQPIPLKQNFYIPMEKGSASNCYKNIMSEIENFQNSLDSEHEVGISLASFGKEILMYVSSIGYQNPDIMLFCGTVNGCEARLIQHMNQLNFLLVSLPKSEPEKPARRIGFSVD